MSDEEETMRQANKPRSLDDSTPAEIMLLSNAIFLANEGSRILASIEDLIEQSPTKGIALQACKSVEQDFKGWVETAPKMREQMRGGESIYEHALYLDMPQKVVQRFKFLTSFRRDFIIKSRTKHLNYARDEYIEAEIDVQNIEADLKTLNLSDLYYNMLQSAGLEDFSLEEVEKGLRDMEKGLDD